MCRATWWMGTGFEKNARMHECKDAPMHGCTNARMHECMDAPINKYMAFNKFYI
jgi:hypothetical protein